MAFLPQARADGGQQPCRSDRARLAAVAERGFAPLHGCPQLAFRNVVGGLHIRMLDEAEQPLRMGEEQARECAHLGVGATQMALSQREELLFQGNGFLPQLLAIDVAAAETVSEAEHRALP